MRFIDEVAQEFSDLLNDWHSAPEQWDDALDKQIHEWYSNVPKSFPKKPYFSPSSAGSDYRELYFKGRGYKAEKNGQQPHQKRWTSIGTAIGDIIQRDVLLIEKHAEKALGYPSPFKFVRTANGEPMFEDFAKKSHAVEHNGVKFHISGSPDGIMIYTDEDGNKIRVGLEIKSKQTTSAKTSLYTMKEPEGKHVEQSMAYAEMYDCHFYLIVYVNTSHKTWSMTPEEFKASPDMRVFGVECTREKKDAILDKFAWLQDCINRGKMPPTDLSKYTFNGFKTATALSLSDEEMAELEAENERLKKSKAPAFVKSNFREALADIKRIREECTDEDLRRKVLAERGLSL
ncbi:MAG: hypothetical protein LC650_04865 [Actinobacteria bacterium]|nr:hypothetical protein [Actinomycetota bacterium]